MSQKDRLATGGRINRAISLTFTFNGKTYQGHQGDTLASALLANGVHFVARSWKYHRPRGIVTADVAEQLLGRCVDPADDPRFVEDVARYADVFQSPLDVAADSQAACRPGHAAECDGCGADSSRGEPESCSWVFVGTAPTSRQGLDCWL